MKIQIHSLLSSPIIVKAVLSVPVLFAFSFSSTAYPNSSNPYTGVINRQTPISASSNPKTSLLAKRPVVEQASQAGWKVYRNDRYGFEIHYPKGSKITENEEIHISLPITSRTTLLEKYLTVSVKQTSAEECSNPGQTIIENTETVTIDGIKFKKEVGAEGAAGSIYDSISYSTMRGSRCFGLNFVLHSVNSSNIDHPPPAFNKAKESQIFDQMLSTFRFISKR